MQNSASPLLSTKLKMPAPRKNYIVRAALFEQLRRCSDMRVVFVKGAAGMGKTTLLSSFIRETGLENTAWLTLDEANNNVFSFWHYFTEAIGRFLGGDHPDTASLILSNFDGMHWQQLLTLLINRLCGKTDYYVVLDDVHCVSDPALIRSLEFFLKSMPSNLHLFMLSRQDPPVYLGEFAVSGELLFLDGDGLRFSHEECLRFLKETLKLTADEKELEQMSAFSEGWIGGLQLIAAAGGVGKAFLPSACGAAGNIAADYLTREIFESLSKDEQRFLTVTGILSYFDEPICSRLMDIPDFSRLIGGLMDKNLFITCIDEETGIYRYHNILGEYLKRQFSRLSRTEQVQLHLKAAQAFEASGDTDEALRHLFAAGQYEEAIRLIRDMSETVETWPYIDQLPMDCLIPDFNLSIQCLMFNFVTMHITRCRDICSALEEHYKGEEMLKGLQFLYQYMSGNYSSMTPAVILPLEQIEKLRLSPVAESLMLIENANMLLEFNWYEPCGQFIDRALEVNHGANLCVDFYCLATKAQLLEEIGRLNDSLTVYRQMESLVDSTVIGNSLKYQHYVGLIGIYHKRMEKEKATQTLTIIRQIVASEKISPDIALLGYDFHEAEFAFLFGDPERGAQILSRMLDNDYLCNNAIHLDRLLNCAYAHRLLKPELAAQFIREFDQYTAKNARILLSSRLIYAKLKADTGEPDAAMRQIETVLTYSREHKNRLRLVEADLLKIRMMVQSSSAPNRNIQNLLREAVNYAYENRLLQPFFLEKQTVQPLLNPFVKFAADSLNKGERQFLQDIQALYTDKSPAGSKELLSAREQEVLGELAKGLTNPEIADRLCISLSTVKTHILNIYGKLGVSSRVAAVEEAKKRNLLN